MSIRMVPDVFVQQAAPEMQHPPLFRKKKKKKKTKIRRFK